MSVSEIVSLSAGKLRGKSLGPVTVFCGVPYAAAPVGTLRFSPPEPHPGWQGLRDATVDTPIAPQLPSRVFAIMGEFVLPQSEDCLTLKIWRPTKNAGLMPVVVWLHGGGFATGAGSLSWYDGANLAERYGVVVVSVNYRLGALGYLAIPDHLPGNLAVLDQEAALRWVQGNIEAFGGNPNRVTVMGQSGGGHTIASMLTMPSTAGLFHRAVLQSPPLGVGLASREEAQVSANIFLNAIGLNPNIDELLPALRTMPVTQILAAQSQASEGIERIKSGNLNPIFRPTEMAPHVVESQSFIEKAGQAAAHRNVDVLIGWARDEANLYYALSQIVSDITEEQLIDTANNLFKADGGTALHRVQQRRPQAELCQWFMDLVADQCFRLPSLEMADHTAQAGGRVFVYQFDWPSPKPGLGACHCIDLPFVFGNWEVWRNSEMLLGAHKEDLKNLSKSVMNSWMGFAIDGDAGFPVWTTNKKCIQHIDHVPWTE